MTHTRTSSCDEHPKASGASRNNGTGMTTPRAAMMSGGATRATHGTTRRHVKPPERTVDQRLAARMHETETMQKKMVRMVTAEAVAVWLPLGSAMSMDHAKATEPYPVLAKRFSLTRTGIPTTAMHTTGATTHTMGWDTI